MRKENRKILSLLLLFLTLIASLLPCGKGILFRARVSLLTCSNSVLGLLSICYLAWTLSFFEFIIYKRAVFSASTYLLWKELLLCIFILSWYGMGDIFERIDDFLVLLLIGNFDFPLGISTLISISILTGIWAN